MADKFLLGIADCKIILDDDGKPVDYIFVNTNRAFEKISGLKRGDIINRPVTKVHPGIIGEEFDWIGFFGNIALNGGREVFEHYSEALGRWYRVTVVSDGEGYFTTVYEELTHFTQFAEASQKLNGYFADNIDYHDIAETMRQISGASFVAFNVFSHNRESFTTRAFAGDGRQIRKAADILGFALEDKKWNLNPRIEARTEGNKTTVFDRLEDIAGNDLPREVLAGLAGVLNISSVAVVKTITDARDLGDFTLFYQGGRRPKNRHLMESYADMVGSVLRRIRSEQQLKQHEEELAGFFDVNLDLLCIADTDGYFIKTNKAWGEILGYSSEELNNRKFLDFVHPDDIQPTLDAMNSLGKQEKVLNFTNRYRSIDGSYRWIEWRSHPKGKLIYAAARDVTDRVRSEKALRESEEKLNLFFSQSMSGFFFMALDEPVDWGNADDKEKTLDYVLNHSRLTRVNQAFLDQYGVTKEQVLKLTIADFFAHDRDQGRELVRKILDQDKAHSESSQHRFDGTPITIMVEYTCIHDDTGKIIGHFGIQRDITEEVELKYRLVDSERYHRSLTMSIPDMLFVISREGNFLDFKADSTNLYARPEDFLGRNFRDVLPPEVSRKKEAAIAEAIERQGVAEFSYSMPVRGGTRFFQARLVPSGGDRLISFVRDVTEQKAAERELSNSYDYQKTVSLVSSSLVKVKAETYDQTVNRILAETARYFAADRAYLFLFSEDLATKTNTHEWCAEGIDPHISDMQQVPVDPLPWWKKKILNKERVHIPEVAALPETAAAEKALFMSQDIKSLLTVPLANEDRYFGFIGLDMVKKHYSWNTQEMERLQTIAHILADSMVRLAKERELVVAKQEADQANKAKSQFLANMSHEIRTPLNGVIGFTELLAKTPLSEAQKQYVDNATMSGHSLMQIINDILDFSKIEAGALELDPVRTDIIGLLENSVDVIAFHAGRKHIEILLDIDADTPRYAVVDPVRLKQIIVNLLGNAVKFTETGEIELKVVFEEERDSGQGHFHFSVRDTGIGISKAQQKKLFKAFSQADSSTTRKYGGTGLGLMISQMIAQKMGSTIALESQREKGSLFYFSITAEFEPDERFTTGDISRVRRCLVVDDNRNNLAILKKMMEEKEVDCVTCDNGPEALKTLERSGPFDVVLMDCHMPSPDGMETAQLIRKDLGLSPETQPLVLMHASTEEPGLQQQCDELGVISRIVKPVKMRDLIAIFSDVGSEDSSADQSHTEPAPSEGEMAEDGTGLSVLIAEDVPMNMILIRSIIGRLLPETQIIEARDGGEALRMFETHRPDLVLMDVQMPEMDGIEVTEKIRNIEKEDGAKRESAGNRTPIVALTAGTASEEREKCIRAGMDDFLSKPVDSEKISDALERLLLQKTREMPEKEPDIPTEDHFDAAELERRLNHNEEDVEEVLSATRDTYPVIIDSLEAAVDSADMKRARALAHQLKGSSLNMCFGRLADLSKRIEMSATEGQLADVREQFELLKIEWKHVLALLGQKLRGD
ncbi:PAS domain S-box protein [Balneolales bacterium ANBcel1]|nr:PAS domain S-box protein [Balneolales bacterium ANBcel1]